MRGKFTGKSVKDTEFAADSLINPTLTGIWQKKNRKHPSRLTVTEQQQESQPMEDLSDKKNH